MSKGFDPFNDRTARDIRNSLSSALVNELSKLEERTVAETAADWKQQVLPAVYRDYIDRCLAVYGQVMRQVEDEVITDPRMQTVILWNAGLFFEMHELLETVWQGAQGKERVGLKGLIQAAGAYVHRQRGNRKAAEGLAKRARLNIVAGAGALGFVANLDTLVRRLEAMSEPPPVIIRAE